MRPACATMAARVAEASASLADANGVFWMEAAHNAAETRKCISSFVGSKDVITEGGYHMKSGLTRAAQLPALDSVFEQGQEATLRSFQLILQGCTRAKNLTLGRVVYSSIVASSLESNTFLGTHLIQLFAVGGSLVEAQKVFGILSKPNVFTWAAIILAHAKLGQKEQAIQLFYVMQHSSVRPDGHVFVAVLNACASRAALTHGRLLHFYILEILSEADQFVRNAMINMYSKCGSFKDARTEFGKSPKRDAVTWGAIISGYVEEGDSQEALQLFQHMGQEGLEPDKVIFVSALKACSKLAALNQGKLIHSHVIEKRFELDDSVGNTVIDLYAKCGSLDDAKEIFDTMPQDDVVTWNAIITGHAMHENGGVVLQLLQQMLQQGMQLNQATFISILKGFSNTAMLYHGQVMHVYAQGSGFGFDLNVGISLINMYSRCGSLQDACRVFDSLPERDLVAWNSLMAGCSQTGHAQKAFELFFKMTQNRVKPDGFSFVSILKVCSGVADLHHGNCILSYMIEMAVSLSTSVGNALLSMYLRCGSLSHACWVFGSLQRRDVITWSVMISGCADCGQVEEALELYHHMHQEGVEPDQVTLVCIQKALSRIAGLQKGMLIHVHATEMGLDSDLFVRNTLIDMYAKCGSLEDAWRIFDRRLEGNIVTWNAMIAGCVDHSLLCEARDLYLQMQETCVEPNQVTYGCILRTCSSTLDLYEGKLYHCCTVESGFDHDVFLANTLIDMYANCGSLQDACKVFEQLQHQDLVSWNAMVSGYVMHGCGQEVFPLFQQMLQVGMKPDQVTLIGILKACSCLGALHQGKLIYSHIVECGYESNSIVGNTLVDMYMKCGSFDDACTVFNKLSNHDIFTWAAMIGGFAQHSHYMLAWEYFKVMQHRGVKPNEVIFGCLFSVCSHLGLVDEGYNIFKVMAEEDSDVPLTVDHFTLTVDLLGRVGYLSEAEDLLQCTPFGPSSQVWMSLLSHSRNHGNMELGQRCFDCLLSEDSQKSGSFVLMSGIYARADMQEQAKKVEEMRKSANAWKEPGMAFIETGKQLHSFSVEGIEQHSYSDVHEKVKSLGMQMKDEGYMPFFGSIVAV